jgi:hypothetical protein
MVSREDIDPNKVAWIKTRNEPTKLYRQPAGRWTLVLDADLRLVLEDGRQIDFVGELRITGKQRGRRPYKNKGLEKANKQKSKRRAIDRRD